MSHLFLPSSKRLKMEIITAVVAWGLSAVCQISATPQWLAPLCAHNTSAELASKLSASAQVYAPGSGGYTEATSRWSVFEAPEINLVAVPGVEDDVAEIVRA
jgi:hypothetical protein